MLSDAERERAEELIAGLQPGRYTARQLYGHMNPRCPHLFGRRFKATALRGALPGIQWVRQRSSRCQEYEVLPAADAANDASHEPEKAAV
jgi:hypothetical protein